MSCARDLTDEQWAVLEPVFNAPGKRGSPELSTDGRSVHRRPLISRTDSGVNGLDPGASTADSAVED
jgi:hypothetical protein